ncbi:PLP-dependent aminotransferase family protein [Psychrilyobacter sp.]|uniref:MocR-like pyridoxine biosynthesis transcription factor PdxR n=1 Tax=Psychrilyobacter sp. TaxID=2586924 RepID=UPI00301B09CB
MNLDNQQILYLQIYEKIKHDIIENKYAEHEKLPSIRNLAKKLEVNNITIVKAYDILEKDRYVYKKRGSGVYINNLNAKKNVLEEEILMETFKYGKLEVEGEINFANSNPNGNYFPITKFKDCINYVIDRDQEKIFAYEDPKGYSGLRNIISKHLKVEEIISDPEDIQIISGAQQGIDLITKSLIHLGDSVIIENPSYSGAITSFKRGGAKIIDVPLLGDGMDLKVLKNILSKKKISYLYLMTNFHNPTGISYSKKKKLKLLELAKKHDFYIIEDDSSSDLYYKDKPFSLKSMDIDERVIYIKSYSRIFMPGLRLGFLIAPKEKLKYISFTKYHTDISTPGLIQRAFEHYLSSDSWETHTKKLRSIYKKKFEISYNLLKRIEHLKLFAVPQGGLYFWVKVDKVTSEALFLKALQKKVGILPGSIFKLNEKSDGWVRLCFADVEIDDIKKGLKILKESIEELYNL